MVATRPLGVLLCVATVLVVIAHIYFGYLSGGTGSWAPGTLAFALPVTVGILAICGLGFWLGWIMVTTKEAQPAPAPKTPEESKPEKSE